jgi:small-conductance mechanosensitive channel
MREQVQGEAQESEQVPVETGKPLAVEGETASPQDLAAAGTPGGEAGSTADAVAVESEELEEAVVATRSASDGSQVDPRPTQTTEVVAKDDSLTPESLSWLDFFKPDGIPYALIIVVLMTVLARFIGSQSEKLGDRFADRRLTIQQTGALLRFVVYILGLGAVTLTLFELTEQMLLAIGGTVAVAAGFAMKDLVASMIAGVIILTDRPFQVGDRVTFAGFYGEIVNIGLRSTRLNTLDDTLVTIPNNLFLTEAVASGNAGAVDMMIQVDLFIGIDQDLEEARRLLSEVVTTSRYVNLNRRWSVQAAQVVEESYLAIRLRAKAYVLDARLEKAFQGDITERALRAFRMARIGPPALLHRSVE